MNTCIHSTGPHITVHSSPVVPYIGSSTSSAGLVTDAVDTIEWAHKKMQEETEAQRMAEQCPAMADALNAVLESQQQFKTIVALGST